MRYAHITLLLATAACAIAIATPAAAQAASTAASAYSNSAAAAPMMRHARRSLDTVQAQIHPQRALGYGSMQAPIGDLRPTQDGVQPTQDDLQNLDKDNQLLNLPATQDDITGAGQVQSQEDALTKKIEQDDPRLDSEISTSAQAAGAPSMRRLRRFISSRRQSTTVSITSPPRRFISGCRQSTTASIISPPRVS